jgi:hypothetical protein
MSNYQTIPVVEYAICDSDEDMHYAEDRNSFDRTDELLHKLRSENPDVEYTMYAEVDA